MTMVVFLVQGTHHITDQEQDSCKMRVGVSIHLCLSKERLEELPKRLREGHIGSLDSRRLERQTQQ